MIGAISLITNSIPTATRQERSSYSDIVKEAQKRYDPNAPELRILTVFLTWLEGTNGANANAAGKINSLQDPEPFFDAMDAVTRRACRRGERSSYSDIVKEAQKRYASNAPEQASLTAFLTWLEGTNGANANAAGKINSLQDPEPFFAAMDCITRQKCGDFLANHLSFVDQNQIELGTGFTTGNTDSSPALEEALDKNFAAKLKYVPLQWQITDDLDLSLSGGLEYSQNIRGDASDTRSVIPSAGLKAKYLPWDAFQLFAGVDYAFKNKNYKSPTLFHPNSNDHQLKIRTGVGTDLNLLSLAAVFGHSYSWFDHELPGFLGLESLKFGGNEEAQTLDLYANWNIAQTFGASTPWVPYQLKLNGRIPIAGKTNLPNVRTINNALIYHQQDVRSLKEWKGSASLEWKGTPIGSFSLFGNISDRKVKGWDPETVTNLGIEYSHEDAGDFRLSYNNWKLDPSNPRQIEGAGLSWTTPWANRSITFNAHTYNLGMGMAVDVLKFFDLDIPGFTMDTAKPGVNAPNPKPQPPAFDAARFAEDACRRATRIPQSRQQCTNSCGVATNEQDAEDCVDRFDDSGI